MTARWQIYHNIGPWSEKKRIGNSSSRNVWYMTGFDIEFNDADRCKLDERQIRSFQVTRAQLHSQLPRRISIKRGRYSKKNPRRGRDIRIICNRLLMRYRVIRESRQRMQSNRIGCAHRKQVAMVWGICAIFNIIFFPMASSDSIVMRAPPRSFQFTNLATEIGLR